MTDKELLELIYKKACDGDLQAMEDLRDVGEQSYADGGKEYLLKLSALLERTLSQETDIEKLRAMYDLHKSVLLLLAKDDLESYILYLECNREPKKKFYPPRRRVLKQVVHALQDLTDDKLDTLAISLPPGVGKALANDTPILTRNGWKQHGDLVVGDEVIGLNGEFKKVIAVHPKCQLDRLVEFTNGETIQCHERHEWMLFNRHKQRIHTEETVYWENLELETGVAGRRGHRYQLQVPSHGYVVGEHKELPLDPYAFGVWLGDGSNRDPRITNPLCDHEIIERMLGHDIVPTCRIIDKNTGVVYWNFKIREQLQSMGMCHSRRTTVKHIPDVYLTASVEQRLQLLAGLIDTDGCLIGSKYMFSNTEKALIDDFVGLVSTFGWRCCVTETLPKLSKSGIQGRKICYVVGFTPDIKIPCALNRKQNKEPHKQRHIYVKSITKVEPKEGNCITVEGDGMYLAGRTLMPTHNTTLAIFYLTWLAGKYPNEPMLTGSHSNSFIRGVYDEVLRLLDPNGEYLWHDVFPDLAVSNTNAKDCRIDIGERQRFETLEFTSIGTGNAGLYRASRLLYCDDLVSGIEVALSKDRLDKLWETYATDLRQRKIGDHCKELHIATRWSVHDVIGRLEERYEGSDRAKFIVIPALNEKDESNFDYDYGVGFNTQFYHEQRQVMDPASWKALYMNEPIERDGCLYPEDSLRRYFELPTGDPDAIIGVCDTKDRGSDFACLPIGYMYGQDVYIVDMVYDDGLPEVVEELEVEALMKHKVQLCRYESNSAGGRVAQKVQEEIKKRGGNTHITTKFTTANKETKILSEAVMVKERFLFLDDTVIKPGSVYHKFMRAMYQYTLSGKNKHDDAPDAMAMLAQYVRSIESGKVEVFQRPW